MTLGEIIKDYRVKYEITMEDFAQMCGLSKGYISMLEKNENPRTKQPIMPTTKTLQAVAETLNISLSELMEKLNDSQPETNVTLEQVVLIPVLGMVRAGVGGLAQEGDCGTESADMKSLRGYARDEFFYLVVKGDSMEPRLYSGDLVLVRKQSGVDSGAYAVVTVDESEGVVKRVEYDKNSITLISQNHNYPPRKFVGEEMERVRIIGKVIESKSKF